MPCSKSFNSQKAYGNHVNSKKHREAQAKFDKKENSDEIKNNRLNRKPEEDAEMNEDDDDEDLEMEEVDSDEWAEGDGDGEPIPLEDCLFCSHHSRDLEKNLIHMTERHSFFVPDLDFVIELETLISYLGEKVI